MKFSLPDSITSRQDLKAVILEIEQYAHWFSQTATKMRFSNNSSYEAPTASPAASELINGWANGQQLTKEHLDEMLKELKSFEASAPYITITLAAPAPNGLKKTLLSWFRQNISKDMLVDFKFNSTILGGMVVVYGSHIFDWSFKRQILSSTQDFAKVLRDV
jgi:hypothetical protein